MRRSPPERVLSGERAASSVPMLGGMTARALFRLRLSDGTVRLASGSPEAGPTALLDPAASIDGLLGAGGGALWERVATATLADGVPDDATLLAPIESQPVWAAGVTYERSRNEREAESVSAADVYALVYGAERPELFLKAAANASCRPATRSGSAATPPGTCPSPSS